MAYYKIAGIVVAYEPLCSMMEGKMERYRIQTEKDTIPEFTIHVTNRFLEQKAEENPHLSREELEYIYAGSIFYQGMIHHGLGCMLHASAIEVDGQGYLFSAPSGTGKSTHTGLWAKVLGKERVRFINDDKPAIREEDGIQYVYGTPFSGKTNLNQNIRVPIGGIAILQRGANRITRITPKEALYPLLNQMERPWSEEDMEQLLMMLDQLLRSVPIYRLECEATEDAAIMAFRQMQRYPGK